MPEGVLRRNAALLVTITPKNNGRPLAARASLC